MVTLSPSVRWVGGLIVCVLAACILHYVQLQKREMVFCDVGQGAATLIQHNDIQILIDTGPDKSVLQCLGQHMPLFDKTIEYVIISHKQQDHDGGLPAIQTRYHIQTLISDEQLTTGAGIQKQMNHLSALSFSIADVTVFINRASESSNRVNDRAYVVTVRTPREVLFLTSDISASELKNLMPADTTILEVPHHGSKYGLYTNSLGLAHPTLAVISVGKKNTYGHPAQSVLAILKAKNIPIWRTDMQGEYVRAL